MRMGIEVPVTLPQIDLGFLWVALRIPLFFPRESLGKKNKTCHNIETLINEINRSMNVVCCVPAVGSVECGVWLLWQAGVCQNTEEPATTRAGTVRSTSYCIRYRVGNTKNQLVAK